MYSVFLVNLNFLRSFLGLTFSVIYNYTKLSDSYVIERNLKNQISEELTPN